jgi:hypothetical protein
VGESSIASAARNRLASQIGYDRDHAVREAQDIAEEAKRIANDIDAAIAGGKVSGLAQKVHHLLVRTAQLNVRKEALELFDAAFPGEGEKR